MRTTAMRFSASVAALVSAFALVACGSSEVSPSILAPTSSTVAVPAPAPAPPPAGSNAGATIAGTVVSGSGAASLVRSASVVGMTVRVVGTWSVGTVEANAQFSRNQVPTGRVQLEFSATGVNARLDLDDVAEHEDIHITVRVSGSTAELDAHARTTVDNKVEIEGRITAITGQTLRVADKDVTVPSGTPIRHGGSTVALADVHVGDRVHVRGTRTGTGVVIATEIELQTTNPGNPGPPVPPPTPPKDDDPKDDHPKDRQEVEVKGQVAGLSGSCPTLHFTVGAYRVATSAKTQFYGAACGQIANNVRVEVKGTKADGSIEATGVQVEKENYDDPHQSIELSGAVSNRSGTCPTITFAVQSKTVGTSKATEFSGTTCATLANGDQVQVKATKQSDGTLLAIGVEKKKKT